MNMHYQPCMGVQNRQLIMHYKQKSQFLEEHNFRQRLNALQSYNYHSSLQESPISSRFREDSDHSPEQYLYPQSLQPFNARRAYDLKQKVVDLLVKLKDWLGELCLTEACILEVNEQLQPIINEIKEGYVEQSNDSCWFSCLPERKTTMKESHSNPYSIIIGDKQVDHNRYQSMLIHQSRERSELWLVSEQQKQMVKLFFKKYYRLLENCLLRITRYSGEKKLKFLLETNIRNIFSETLRISYDLKLIQYKLKEERTVRVERNKLAYVCLMSHRIGQLLVERGGVRKSFKLMRSIYVEQTRKDHVLVGDMLAKMSKLSKIYTKNKQSNLQHFTYKWRESAYRAKIEEDVFLVDCIRTKMQHILTELVDFGEKAEQFSNHWRCLIERNLNSLCFQLFEDEDCFFLDLQEMLNERYSKREKHISLIEFLSEAEADMNQSNISRNRSFLNDLTLDELRTCLFSGQIHKSDKSDHNLLLIPIKAASGIFFVRLQPSNSSADSRMPMRLSSFRCLLRIVELMTPILDDLVSVCKRLESCWHQVQKNDHYSILLKEFLKMDLLKSQQGHMQMECKHSEIQINSNRLQSSSEVANAILERCGIDNLMIYHCGKDAGINEMPCIVYGDGDLALSQKYIIQSIYEQLVSSGKKVLIVNRNGQFFNILPLQGQKGLVHYTAVTSEKIDNQMISQCLVPLLLRGEGKMSCESCKIQLRLPKPIEASVLSEPEAESNDSTRLALSSASKLVTCSSILQLQADCSLLLRKRGHFFFKMIYKLDFSDLANFFSLDRQGQISHHTLKQSQKVIHSQMFIQDYSTLAVSSLFAKIAYSSPCFDNPQLHIYQNQNNLIFKLVAVPIKNDGGHYGYFLVGFYQSDQKVSEENIAYFQSMVSCINLNRRVFRAIKLDNQELLQHYGLLNQKRNQEIMHMVFQHLRESNGKFAQSFNDNASNLLQKLIKVNQSKSHISITSFKLNKKSNQIKPVASTKPIKGQSFKSQQELITLLDQNYLTFTHQKLMSNQCKLKRPSFNRTIKPFKLQKLNSISIFLPDICQQSNEHLFAIIDRKYKLKGLVANEYCPIIQELDHRLSVEPCKGNQMYVLMKVGSDQQRNESYFVMLQEEVAQGNDQPKLNEFVAEKTQEVFAKVYRKSRLFEAGQLNRRKAIEILENTIMGNYNVSQAVKVFYENWIRRKESTLKLTKVLEKFIPQVIAKNIKYYSLLAHSFNCIKAIRVATVKRYQIFIQKILPTVNNIHEKTGKRQAFNNIQNSIQEPLTFSHIRSVGKIYPILQKQLTSVLKQQFTAILITSQLRHHSKTINKNLSAFRISHILTSLQRKHHYHYFFSQLHKAFQHFLDGFELIAQEYQHIQFSSRQSFIIFANERFQTLLRHIGFGSVQSIEVGAAQINGKQMILYKPDSDKKMQEVVTNKPQTFQPEAHNNFHFVPVKVKSCSSHFLLYRIKLKEATKNDKYIQIARNAIISGLIPNYKRYLQSHLQRAEKLCLTLLNISCKEIWNGAVEQAQGIYIFGKGNNHQQQCMKIRALSAIKHTKRAQSITELKLIRNAINQESKQYYRLQYEHNSISNALSCGIPHPLSKEEAEIFQKYGDFIAKDKLRETRENTEKMENEYQRKSLQYQIKSKTFATSKIIMYYDKKEKTELEGLSRSFLIQTNENQDSSNLNTFQKAIVEGKIELSSNREKIKKVQKRQKLASARSIYLLLSNCNKTHLSHTKHLAFKTILWPRQGHLRA